MPKVILLPGMDGTGELFSPLLGALPDYLKPTVVTLNAIKPSECVSKSERVNRYDVEFEYLRQLIGNDRVVLVAESYSGYLAYRLCQEIPSQVCQVIFIASFISTPSFWARLGAVIPSGLINPSLAPHWLLNKFCFAGFGKPHHIAALINTTHKVEKPLLASRIRAIAELTKPTATVAIPTIYIRPKQDYLVNQQAVNYVASMFPRLRVEHLEGGHFLAQTHPDECAAIISQCIKNAT